MKDDLNIRNGVLRSFPAENHISDFIEEFSLYTQKKKMLVISNRLLIIIIPVG